jgi:HK97 family phage major capsid protein
MTLAEMRRRRAELREQLRQIHAAAEQRNENLTEAEQGQWDTHTAEVRSLDGRIARGEQCDAMEQAAGNAADTAQQRSGGDDFEAQLQTRSYSLLRAVACFIDNRPFDGWEAEVSQELARRSGKKPQGFLFPTILPLDVRAAERGRQIAGVHRRDLDTSAGAGAVQVNTPATYIEYLRNRTVVVRAGARMLPNLMGKLALPKQSATATVSWVAEGAAPSASNAQLGSVTLQPRTIAARTLITRRMMAQTSLDVEMFARQDLADAVGVGIDTAALAGPTAGQNPVGLLYNTSVPTVAIGTNGGAWTWGKVVDLEGSIFTNNADMAGMAYISNAKVRGHAKQTVKVTGYPVFLMADDGTVNGYPFFTTNSVPSNLTKGSSSGVCSAAFFGNFADMLIGMWGGLDILPDPYTSGGSGGLNLYALQDADIVNRHDESFAKTPDILA